MIGKRRNRRERNLLIPRPDLRHLARPRLSAAPLDPDEVDYDDLHVHSTFRSFDPDIPDAVRYFNYELSQRDPGPVSAEHEHFYKAARFVRVTRVPRFVRQQKSVALNAQRDVLSALRERGCLFVNLVANSPDLPLVFAYGVQATGRTLEEAQGKVDESFEVLLAQLDGTFQQLEYEPLKVADGERLAQYQQQWRNLAVARGRPMPASGKASNTSLLDGNRTDVESASHALDAFIRGMSDRSFMLSLVTTPISPGDMTLAWRNLTKKLGEVRSQQHGQRAFTAGVALPIGFGASLGETHGGSHAAAESSGVGMSDATSRTVTAAESLSLAEGQSASVSHASTTGVTDSVSQGASETASVSESFGRSVGHSEGASVSQADGVTVGQSESATVGQSQGVARGTSVSETQGLTQTQTVGQSQGLSHSQSASEAFSESLSQGQSVSQSQTDGMTHSQSTGQNASASQTTGSTETVTRSEGVSEGASTSLSQNLGMTDTDTESTTDSSGESETVSSGLRAGMTSLQSGDSESLTEALARGDSDALSAGLSAGGSRSVDLSQSLAEAVGITNTSGVTEGVSVGESVGASRSVGVTEGATLTQGVGQTTSLGESATQSASQSVSAAEAFATTVGRGESLQQSMAQSTAQTRGATQSVSQTSAVGSTATQSATQSSSAATASSVGATRAVGQSVSESATVGQASGVSRTETAGVSSSVADGVSAANSQNRTMSDTYIAALSQAAQQTTSLGAVPSFGISVSRETFDEIARVKGDMLEAQMERYLEGVRGGAFFYQLFLQTPDRATLQGGAGLLKSSFWGDRTEQLPQPFHVIDQFDDEGEQHRLLTHAQAWTTYRRVEEAVELIEPYRYSSYLTPQEGAIFTAPPTAESLGLLAVHDSMPVFAMPHDREDADLYLGHVVNGERARVTSTRFGLNLSEITHTLVAGATGSGKTTSTLRLLTEAVRARRELVDRDPNDPTKAERREVAAGAVCLDWGDSYRDLMHVVEPERFRFYSVQKPELGRFRFNPLALPDPNIDASSWASTVSDLFMMSYGLGEFARSIIWEVISDLYSANRLQPFTLRPAIVDDDGIVLREAMELPAIDPAELPDGAVAEGPGGSRVANVFTCPELSRLVGFPHLAVMVMSRIEQLAAPGAVNLTGGNMRDRLQTVWRRLMYFAPGEALGDLFAADENLRDREALGVLDLVDPDRGLVTVIETEGLDFENRRFVLGSVLLSMWRFAQYHGKGVFDHKGKGPGTFVVLEEAHELFGMQPTDDATTTQTRNAIYESLFRRARSYGMRLVACVQNAASVPPSITSNTSTVVVHKTFDGADKKAISQLMNWKGDTVGQHLRESRYLGEMADGWAIVRLNPKTNYLQAAPIHIRVDPVDLPEVSDQMLLARRTVG